MRRVALLTPFAPPSVRGNAITVARIARGLAERGIEHRVWDLSVTPEPIVEAEVDAYRPSVVHAFHAFRMGPLAVRLARAAEIPLIVTLTGTDANHDLFDPERAAVVRRVLEAASRLTVFHSSVSARIGGALPDLAARVVTIPQAVRLERGAAFDLPAGWSLPPDRVLFLFPAGIRMVKNPQMPLRPFSRLIARQPSMRLAYAGPILDAAEGEALLAALTGLRWVRYLGPVPHAQMASLIGEADVVLNCSVSEGGMANSVLEALALGRAVIASDIPGNRSLIENGVTGLLAADAAELEAAAEQLIRDRELRERLGRAGRELVERRYPATREIDGYVEVYSALMPVRR